MAGVPLMAETLSAGLKQTPAGLSQHKHTPFYTYKLSTSPSVTPPHTHKFLMTDSLKTGKELLGPSDGMEIILSWVFVET